MAYAGGKEIINSFNLELTNLDSQSSREVNLFRLGGDLYSPDTIPSPINFTTQGLDSFRGFFIYSVNPPTTLQEILNLGNLVITLTNTDGDTISTSSIPGGSGFTAINAVLNSALTSSSGWYDGIQVEVVFNFDNTSGALSSLPAVAYIMYTQDFDLDTIANKGVVSMTFTSSSVGTGTIPISLSLLPAYKTGGVVKSGGIIITPRNGIGYGEILESQNGQVLDIKTMNFTISTNSTCAEKIQKEQVYNCFTFEKQDSNGNLIEYRKCPVVDVFSNPNINSIDDIQLERKADVYTLDGTTNLNYTLRAGIVVQLGAEYTNLTNLLQESEKGQEQILVEKKNIQKKRLNTDYALEKVAIIQESQKNKKEFNFSGDENKKKSIILHNNLLMFGGIATLLLMLNNK